METDAVDGAEGIGAKFRTTPITSTIQQVKQLPQSASIACEYTHLENVT